MYGKKGFTLIEVLVVVVLIAIVSMLAFPSFKKSREVAKNEAARGKLLEVANAARMYNEDSDQYVVGKLGTAHTGFKNPIVLFWTSPSSPKEKDAYLKNKDSWDWPTASEATYKGYTYYICNPGDIGGPANPEPCKSHNAIAVMESPSGTKGRYEGVAWVSSDELGKVKNNYKMNEEVVYQGSGS